MAAAVRSAALVLLVWAAALGVTSATAGEPPFEPVTLRGTAVLLPDALKARGLTADTEPIAGQVVLKAADGALTPLLSDDASRALFRDDRLRGRDTEVRGRRHPGLPYVQVITFRIDWEGNLRTPEYYCEVCTISVRYPQTCPCCQGPMELRMKPERP